MRTIIWITLAATAFAAVAAAAPAGDGKAAADADEVRAALNQLKEDKLEDLLALPQDDNDAFVTLYNQLEETRWRYHERRAALLDELQTTLLAAPAAGVSIGRPLKEILDDVDATDREAATAEADLRAEFRAVLADERYAKVLLFEYNFSKNLRKLVQERQRWTDTDESASEK